MATTGEAKQPGQQEARKDELNRTSIIGLRAKLEGKVVELGDCETYFRRWGLTSPIPSNVRPHSAKILDNPSIDAVHIFIREPPGKLAKEGCPAMLLQFGEYAIEHRGGNVAVKLLPTSEGQLLAKGLGLPNPANSPVFFFALSETPEPAGNALQIDVRPSRIMFYESTPVKEIDLYLQLQVYVAGLLEELRASMIRQLRAQEDFGGRAHPG